MKFLDSIVDHVVFKLEDDLARLGINFLSLEFPEKLYISDPRTEYELNKIIGLDHPSIRTLLKELLRTELYSAGIRTHTIPDMHILDPIIENIRCSGIDAREEK